MLRALLFVVVVALCCESDIPADPLSAPVVIVFPVLPSGCRYFPSLTEALQVPASPVLRIHIRPTSAGVQLTGDITVTEEVEIYANNTLLEVSGTVTIQGSVNIVGAEMRVSGDIDTPVLIVSEGTFTLQGGKIVGGNRSFIRVLAGNVTISHCTFQETKNSILTLQSANFQLFMDQLSITNCSSLIEINYRAARYEGYAQLTDINMSNSSHLLWCGNCALGSLQLHIQDSVFLDSCENLISGVVENLQIYMENVTFQGINSFVNGSLYNSTLDIRNSTVRQLQKIFISLSALSGEINIENTEFTEVQGPIVLLPANPYSPEVAIVSFHHCSISALQNVEGIGAIFCCSSVFLAIQSVEIRDSYVFTSGLFQMTSGIVHLSQVNYHDSAGYFGAVYEAQATELLMTDSRFDNLTVREGYFSCCVASSNCLWRNVSMTGIFDPAQYPILLYTWGGFLGNATVTDSYFRPAHRKSLLSLGAAAHGLLYVADCVFEDLWNYETFGSYTDSFVSLTNLTLIRPSLDILFSCVFSPLCLVAEKVTVVGDSHIAVVIQSNSGIAQVRSASFSDISHAVIVATNANISFTSVAVSNFAGVVCRSCANSQISLQSLTLEHATASVEFEMAYSQVVLRNVFLRDFTCQQIILLENTKLTIIDSVFEDLKVHSFGGVINAAFSEITITGTTLTHVSSILSMYIGLIYLESSSLAVTSSSFSDFNLTLIHSVNSPALTFLSTRFYNTEASAIESISNVWLRGGVLWSEYTPLVRFAGCDFLNMAADDGGVLYLSGTGVEVCEIENSTAAFNTAKDSGGFLYSDGVNVVIRDCDFVGNSAAKGGALALFRETKNIINGSLFSRNSATFEGGALSFLQTRNDISSCEWVNNSALYGPDIASEVTSLSLLDESFKATSNYSIAAVSGQSYKTPLLIGCIDVYGQIVSTDNGSKLSLFTLEANSSIVVSSLLESSGGVYRIPSITVIGAPGFMISVLGTYRANLTLPLFTAALRECEPGEYFSDQQCKLCSHNTYSFHPSQPCTLCPDQADCPSGALMSLHEGYWRIRNDTDDIYTCIIPELCFGGFASNCISGQGGLLCNSCFPDYFKLNQLQCISCGPLPVSVIKAIVSAAISVALTAYCLFRSLKSVLLHAAVFDYLQTLWIMASFNVYWPEFLAYLFSILGNIGSLGLTAFTDSCFGEIGPLSEFHSPFLILLIYLILLGVLFLLIGVTYYRSCFKLFSIQFLGALLYVHYLVLPVMYYRVFQLFPCVSVPDSRYLILNTEIECWTNSHIRLILGTALPVILLAVIVLSCLTTASIKGNFLLAPWRALYLLILLLRKLLLISLLLFSATFALSTQVVLAMAINALAEAGVFWLEKLNIPPGLALYERTVLASTVLMFAFAIYGSSQSAEKAVPLIVIVLVVALSPVLIPLCHKLCFPVRVAQGTVIPSRNSSMDAINSSSVELEISEIEAPSPSLQTPITPEALRC